MTTKALGNQEADHITVATYLVIEGHTRSTLAAIKLVDRFHDIVDKGIRLGSFTNYVANEVLEAYEKQKVEEAKIPKEIVDFMEG